MLTWVSINRSALRHNVRAFSRHVGRSVQLMPVVKANAYGHGLLQVAKICDQEKSVKRLCVATLAEALRLREEGIKKPILVLSAFELETKLLAKAVQKNIALPVYTKEQMLFLNRLGNRLGQRIRVHLKLDTGTSRVGFLWTEAAAAVHELKKCSSLQWEGTWSHFSSSESNPAVTRNQWQRFTTALAKIKKNTPLPPVIHFACTAATIRNKAYRGTGVRIGLGIYGLYPAPGLRRFISLKPVLSWYTRIAQVKTIPAGSKIGYGGTYTARQPMKLAVLPVGYYDGLPRTISNRGYVLIGGKRCPIRGRVCMNLIMVDVSQVKNAKAGDTATLIGGKGKNTITAEDVAAWSDTINYEAVTRINPLIPRIAV